MISGEQIIEPSKMVKASEFNQQRSSSNNQKRQNGNRENSVKKTNIEILDHETPIEQYQQYYNEHQNSDFASDPQQLA